MKGVKKLAAPNNKLQPCSPRGFDVVLPENKCEPRKNDPD